MEFLFEVLVELILEGTIETSKNVKISTIIRYPLIFVIIVLFIGIIFYTGILAYQRLNKICGIFFMLISIILLISCIIKLKNVYLLKKDSNK